MRLQKYLARAGVASRRASEELIRAGRVKVDGEVVVVQGVQVDPECSVVEVDGRRVRPAPPRWVMLHKPPGCLCTRSDPQGRPTAYELMDPSVADLFHVGRLDYMSEGLLLLTNEGAVAETILHPRNRVTRRYEVTVERPLPADLEERLRAGVELDDGVAHVVSIRRIPGGRSDETILELSLREGRNREVRRLMEAVGLTIHSLKRVAFGPLELKNLPRGSWRSLEPHEIERLRGLERRG
jgi:23S rRNA pseudouridine2605 synthase